MKAVFKVVLAVSLFVGLVNSSNATLITETYDNVPVVIDSSNTDNKLAWFSQDFSGELESFELVVDWRDQRWGNRKGQIFYSIDNGSWINLGGLAPHSWATQSFLIDGFMNVADSTLSFAYRVGGGGGHQLRIRDASLAITTVPEPATLAIFLGGLALLVSRKRV